MPDEIVHPGVYVQEPSSGVPSISGVATSITAFLGRALRGPVDEPVAITSFVEFERLYGGLWAESSLGFSVRNFFGNGGTNAVIVRLHRADGDPAGDGLPLDAAAFIGEDKRAEEKGLFALARVDLFNLLVIPPYRADGDVDSEVKAAAVAFCEERRAVAVLDPPAAWTSVAAAAAGVAEITSSKNATLYFPRLRQSNPLRANAVDTFAPSGAVAGIIARTDATRGFWKAPAGVDAQLVGVTDLSMPIRDADVDALNPVGINCLSIVPGAGAVVWGARTRAGDDRLASEWKYLPVRRTALFLEESLYRGTKWAVFEPNDEALWAKIRLAVGSFLDQLFRQGAFQGRTASEAYFVKCDQDTMTQNDIDNGTINLVVGFAPLKPAEFVVLRISQIAGGGQ